MAIAVKISEENYRRLSALSGTLQAKLEKPVSLNDAITYLCIKQKGKLSDLAGKWEMNDQEREKMKTVLKKGWKEWNKSA